MKDEKSRLSSVKQQTPFVLTWGRAIHWIKHHNDGLGKPNAETLYPVDTFSHLLSYWGCTLERKTYNKKSVVLVKKKPYPLFSVVVVVLFFPTHTFFFIPYFKKNKRE